MRNRRALSVPAARAAVASPAWTVNLITATGCHAWQGSRTSDGYGLVRLAHGGQPFYAHRVSWAAEHGVDPAGDVDVNHLCRRRSCVNPDHLEATGHARNLARGLGPRLPGMRAEAASWLGLSPQAYRQRYGWAAGAAAGVLALRDAGLAPETVTPELAYGFMGV